MKSFGLPETIWQDVRFASRTLRKNQTFAALFLAAALAASYIPALRAMRTHPMAALRV